MKSNPMDKQIGGNHYLYLRYQLIEFAQDTDMNFALANALKYLVRFPNKNQDDLDKAIDYLEKYLDWYSKNDDKPFLSPDYIAVNDFISQFSGDKPKHKAIRAVLDCYVYASGRLVDYENVVINAINVIKEYRGQYENNT